MHLAILYVNFNTSILPLASKFSMASCTQPSQVNATDKLHCFRLTRWIYVQVFTITSTAVAKLKITTLWETLRKKKCLEKHKLTRRILPLEAAGNSKKGLSLILLKITVIRLHRMVRKSPHSNRRTKQDSGNTGEKRFTVASSCTDTDFPSRTLG